jgi:hypothetical protein
LPFRCRGSRRESAVAQLFSLGITMFSCIPANLWQPLATCLVGVVLAFIALLQFKVAHDKLRLELFDRRYKVYATTKKFLIVVVRNARFERSDLFEFFAGTADADFLFDKDILDYLKQIADRATAMDVLQKKFYPMPAGDERDRLADKEHIEFVWLTHQVTDMSKVFSPYLSYAKIKSTFLEDFINKQH